MGGQHPLFHDSHDRNCCCSCSLEPRGCCPFISSCNTRDHSLSWLWGSWWVCVEHAQKIPLGRAPLAAALSKQLELCLWGAGKVLLDRNCLYGKALLPQLRKITRWNKLMTGKGTLWPPFSDGVFSLSSSKVTKLTSALPDSITLSGTPVPTLKRSGNAIVSAYLDMSLGFTFLN